MLNEEVGHMSVIALHNNTTPISAATFSAAAAAAVF
jgi:hypothetical protein